jgi:signal transduction histidine kinase
LRPATNVTWDDLRLAPLLDNLLAGCLTRLCALQRGLADPQEAGGQAVGHYLQQHALHQHQLAPFRPGKLTEQGQLKKLADDAKSAIEAVVQTMTDGTTQMLDQIFVDNSKAIDSLRRLTNNHLGPMLGPLAHLPRDSAIALGVSPETSLVAPDEIPRDIEILVGIAQTRRIAWDDLRSKLQQLTSENIAAFEEAIGSAADAIVQTEGPKALKERFTQFREQSKGSTEALRTAIRLFQVAPQEIGSSLAYLTLQCRNARSYMRGHLSYEHNLITTAYSQSKYRYPREFVDNWPLYRITQRLERLFYGGKDEEERQGLEESEYEDIIRNITFIPVSYFPGQIIGQVVMSTPIELDVPSLIDFSQYYIREIRGAATAEFISLIQRSLQRHKPAERIDNSAVLRAVAESLTTILSVQALSAFVRTKAGSGRASSYRSVYSAAREAGPQPHDLINAYLNSKLPTNLKDVWPKDIWLQDKERDVEEDVERYSLRYFLKVGLKVIGMTRHPLKPEATPLSIDDHVQLDSYFDERVPERVFVLSNISVADHTSKERTTEDVPPGLLRLLRKITNAREDAHDSFLLLRLPLGDSDDEGKTVEAVLIARLWEPASAVKNMTLSVLHTVWNGIRSCRALIDVADKAAMVAGTRDVGHTLEGPIGAAKSFFKREVMASLKSCPEDLQTALNKTDKSLTDLHSRAQGVKQRWLRRDQIRPDLGKCDILSVAKRAVDTEYFKTFWKRKDIELRLRLDAQSSGPLVVRGSAEDWKMILETLLKNAYEATDNLRKTSEGPAAAGTAYVDLIFEPEPAVGGVVTNLDIKVRNPGSVPDKTRQAMLACLRNEQAHMRSDKNKLDAMGYGLGLVGEQLVLLNVTPRVSSDEGTVEISLSEVQVL